MFWQPQQTHSSCSLTENFLCSLSVLTRSTHGPVGETKPGLGTLCCRTPHSMHAGCGFFWDTWGWAAFFLKACTLMWSYILVRSCMWENICASSTTKRSIHQVLWWLQSKSEKHGNDEWIEAGDRASDGDGGGFLFLHYTVEKKCFGDEPGYLKELKPTSWRAPWVAIKYLWSWTSEVPLCDLWQITSLIFICQR